MLKHLLLAGVAAILLMAALPAVADGPAYTGADKADSAATGTVASGTSGTVASDTSGTASSASAGTTAAGDDNNIRLTPDKTRILILDQDAASILVTNPAHAEVVLESPRKIIILPRTPGTTGLSILDAQGQPIMDRNIIVTGAQQNYVRIRRSCAGARSGGCVPDAYYYCPDGCYEISTVEASRNGMRIPELPMRAPADSDADADSIDMDEMEENMGDMTPEELIERIEQFQEMQQTPFPANNMMEGQ